MVDIKSDNLEKALNENKINNTDNSQKQQVPKEVEIGFHQGAINTLLNERNEFVRMIKQIESIVQAHIKRLEELGVKVEQKTSKNE